MHRHHAHRWRTRSRRRRADGTWEVRARVERFGEPALLVLLADGPTHGYELLERLPALLGDDRVDVGNVYRALRAFEDEGLVSSEWRADLPGPAKRTYTLTPEGREVLASWLASLESLQSSLTAFLERARTEGGDHVRKASPRNVEVARSEP
jgi:PadR family transcriptional regulator PadR